MAGKRVFTIETPSRGFPQTFYFNQFSIEHDEAGVLISFGYLSKGRLLDDVLSVVVPSETLSQAHDSMVEYLGKAGEILPMEPVVPVRPGSRLLLVNMIQVAYRGEVAETALCNFSFRLTLSDSKETTFEAEPVALLRSPLNVQRNLVKALFAEAILKK